VTVRANEREGLEKLCRYGARPPFSLERGCSCLMAVAYLLRKPRRNGATHLVLNPTHSLAWIAAFLPPPRYPLTRLAGVLAPHSTWRAAVVKYGRDETTAPPAPQAPTLKKQSKKRSAALELAAHEPRRRHRQAGRRPDRLGVDASQNPPGRRPRLSLRRPSQDHRRRGRPDR
jgi:hypothetical protein